ncbi:MAG: hypothetical protein AAFP28_01955 [Pseudomonadota bacterium]
MKRILALTAAAFLWTSTATAQQTFEQTVAAAQAAVGDIARYQEALQNPDPRFQYAMVQQMLKLPDPALQRIAKEHALFSTNPVMREAAIKAIFDSGTLLRIQLAGTADAYPDFTDFVKSNGGFFQNKSGEFLMRVPAALGNDCWGKDNKCILRQVGNTIQFNRFSGYANEANGTATLGNDGIMRGAISMKRGKETIQMQIDLKQ